MDQFFRNLSLTDLQAAVWRDRVCFFLDSDSLTRVALVDKSIASQSHGSLSTDIVDWNEAATKWLYESPDLSRCNKTQLQSFFQSVKGAKSRRRRVKVLDLLETRHNLEEMRFEEKDMCKVDSQQTFRYDPLTFEELFALFKNLVSVRIYGHSLHDAIRAHWKSLGQSLVELRIYNLGRLTDAGLLKITASLAQTLRILHIEHPNDRTRSLRVGTIDSIMVCVPNLIHLGIGLPLENIKNNRNLLEALFNLESLTLLRVPDVDFVQLNMAQLDCKWKYLVVRDCPNMRAKDLDAVFKRLPVLVSLDWRFPEDTFYDWEENELKTAGCRRLQNLVLENGFFADQCLMRIFRVTSSLQSVALHNCENIHRIRQCCAGHYIIKGLPSFLDLMDAFEDCLPDLRSIILVQQSFDSGRKLASTIYRLFREATYLDFVELRQCHITSENLEELIATVGRWTTVDITDCSVRFTANYKTVREEKRVTRSFKPRYRPRY